MDAVAELDSLLKRGLVADIFRMERAHSLLEAIGANAAQLNDRNNGNFGDLFGALQSSLVVDCLLSTARLFDRPNPRYPTRCMRYVVNFVGDHAAALPALREPYQLGLALQAAGLEATLGPYVAKGSSDFAMSLVAYYSALLDNAATSATIEALKTIRDKAVAHNEHVESVTGPTWAEMRQLVAHAKHFVGILGWTWAGTAYAINGTFILTEDAMRPRHAFSRLLERLSNGKKNFAT